MPSLTPAAWARVRYEYEHTRRTIEDICLAHGISSGTLRDRMRRWGWTRRQRPIPHEGPETLTVRLIEHRPGEAAGESSPDSVQRNPGPASPQQASHSVSRHAGDRPLDDSVPAPGDPAAVVTGLRNAVARMLPAIEAIAARLAAGGHAPRDIAEMGRALGVLTRTLRELSAFLAEHRDIAAATDRDAADDPTPQDIDEFRLELARRIDAFVAEREAEEDDLAETSTP